MLWKADDKVVNECKLELHNRENEINSEKKPLFNELVKLLNEGYSQNREDYPDIYKG
jgi:hypothetical protein